jgi:hypothetical protein
LLQSGIGTVAACKSLGIGRRIRLATAGQDGGPPPVWLAEYSRSGRYIPLLER